MKLSFLGDFNGNVGKCAEGFKGVHGENGIKKRIAKERRLLEFSDEKELCFIRQTKGKSLIALVDVKQKLILCLWGKIQKVCKGCENDSINFTID